MMLKNTIAIMIFVVFMLGCRFVGQVISTSDENNPNPGTSADPVQVATQILEDEYQNIDPSGRVVVFWHPFTGGREKSIQEIVDSFNAETQMGNKGNCEYLRKFYKHLRSNVKCDQYARYATKESGSNA